MRRTTSREISGSSRAATFHNRHATDSPTEWLEPVRRWERAQRFHLDANAARASILRGLAASGWHGAALTMRLLVESELKPAGGIVGTGFDELRWPRPVRPGDELRVESQVLKSRLENGLLKVRTTTLNQNGEAVQVLVANLIVPRRPTNTPAG